MPCDSKLALLALIPRMAVIFAVPFSELRSVVIGKVAEADPAGIVTVPGTLRMPDVESRLTVVAVSTGPAMLIVPVALAPPSIDVGSVNDSR